MSRELAYDAVVIGAGVAGLTAGARLAEDGARVCVLAKGVGSTHLAAGTVDVLGYAPEQVQEPARALPEFAAAHPEHPYALLGVDAIAPALEWFRGAVARGPQPGYGYTGGLQRNHLLPTAIGAVRPSALVPETMTAGDVDGGEPVCVAGIAGLRDFHASLCAANLSHAGIEARAIELQLELGRAEVNALGIARRFDRPGFAAAVSARLAPLLRAGERLALPAVLGLRDPHGAWSELQRRLDRPVFEIPTLPPSVSGMRVYDALRAALRAADGRLVLGAEVVGTARDGERVTAVHARTSGHETAFRARCFVVATGGFASGALELTTDWQVRDAALGLPLRGVPGPGEPRFAADYFAQQPIARVGVAVDGSLRAEGTENVLVAGAALPGAEPWSEGSGEGIALASGHHLAQLVHQRERTSAAA